ncbi:hypothetical protein SAMN03159423_4510 [Bradyrhizobium sp. NFR13]|nr:hypothetical protein SAMN03159423_4510 [Bradyrhizobium sp. NFR13]
MLHLCNQDAFFELKALERKVIAVDYFVDRRNLIIRRVAEHQSATALRTAPKRCLRYLSLCPELINAITDRRGTGACNKTGYST